MHKRMIEHPLLRMVLIVCGWIAVTLGVAGIFLPVLPTVPFLLLASACFAKSSEVFHEWLVRHDRLGPLLQDYLNGEGIPLRAKVSAVVMICSSISVSALFFVDSPRLKLALVAIALVLCGYLLSRPTLPRNGRGNRQ